ncbi:MAG: alpha/beta hydrolase [Thermomicrobiales bacterium]
MRYIVRFLLLLVMVAAAGLPGFARGVLAQEASPVASPVRAGDEDFAGLVDIGGRSLFLQCEGAGSPTVVLEAGRFASETWAAVMAGVAPTTRVCRYDRANTGQSDPAPLPRSGEDVVADLHALLTAADVPGPYVLVGGGLGGLFTRLYAATYPDEVAGMVLVDAVYEEVFNLQGLLNTPADMAETLRLDFAGGDPEGIWTPESVEVTFAQAREARLAGPFPAIPLVVLAAGTFYGGPDSPYPPASDAVWPGLSVLIQQTLATLTPDARYELVPDSGSQIQVDRPDAVIAAIAEVVGAVRDPGTWGTVAGATPAP